jgi:chromosomal replication initiator protein
VPLQHHTSRSIDDELLAHCLARLEQELPQQQFRSWILPLHCKTEGRVLVLTAPNRFVMQWVRDRFLSRIHELALDHLGAEIGIQLRLREKIAEPDSPPLPLADPPAPRVNVRELSRLNGSFTFDTFVTGKANELARAAANQVAERPGTAYNPLFIYGGVGLGKTHLIHAIGNAVLARAADSKIRYIHAEQYVSDVVRAYQHKAFDDFKRFYHSLASSDRRYPVLRRQSRAEKFFYVQRAN